MVIRHRGLDRHRERSEAIHDRRLPRLLRSLAMTGSNLAMTGSKLAMASFVAMTALVIASPALASPQQLIERAQSAAETLSFQGSFVHQQESVLHTSKITQGRRGNDMITRVQALEGFRQEVVRGPSETRTYWPDKQMVKIDQTGLKRSAFPRLFIGNPQQILANYEIKQAGTIRIANLDATEYAITPKHAGRWPMRIWVDRNSGMILKCQKLATDDRVVEQAAFTELSFSAKPIQVALAPSYTDIKNWKTHDASMTRIDSAPELKFSQETLKGFDRVGVFDRNTSDSKQASVRRYVFSDGIATVSVFVQSKAVSGPLTDKVRHRGALSMLSREIGDTWITVMGDIPPDALARFAQTIEWKN